MPGATQNLGSQKPLFSTQVHLNPVRGEHDLRTRNSTESDWERHNVIERTGSSIDVYCELMDVKHGNIGSHAGSSDLATLMVYRFRFDPQKQSRRVIRARAQVEVTAAKKGAKCPEVVAMAPEERWSLMPTKDQVETSSGTEMSIGTSQVVEASGKVNWSRTVSKDASGATIVTGSKKMATHHDSGPYTCATWTFLENEKRKSGVPDSVRVAVLVRRDNDEPFHVSVGLEVDADIASKIGSFFKRVPIDDPVLFNPKADSNRPRAGRAHGVMNLGHVDLYSLTDARISAAAFWVKTK